MPITYSRNFSRTSLVAALVVLFLTGLGLPSLFNIKFATSYPDFLSAGKLSSTSPAYLKVFIDDTVDRDRLFDELSQVSGIANIEDEYPTDFFYWNALFYIPFGELVVMKDSVLKDDIKGLDRFLNLYSTSNNPLGLPLLGGVNKLKTTDGRHVVLLSLHELDPLQYMDMHNVVSKICSNLKAELSDPYFDTIKFEKRSSVLPGSIILAYIIFCSLVILFIFRSASSFFINFMALLSFFGISIFITDFFAVPISINIFITLINISAIFQMWLVGIYSLLSYKNAAISIATENVVSYTRWFTELKSLYYSMGAQLVFIVVVGFIGFSYKNWHIYEFAKIILIFSSVTSILLIGFVPLLCSRISMENWNVLDISFLERLEPYRLIVAFVSGLILLLCTISLVLVPYNFKIADVVKNVWKEPVLAGNIFPPKSLNHILYISNAMSLERASTILSNHRIRSYSINKFTPDSLNERLSLISSIRDYCKKKNIQHDVCQMAKFNSFSLDRLPYLIRHFYYNRIFIEDDGEQRTWSSIISIQKTFNARLATSFKDLQLYKSDLKKFTVLSLVLFLVLFMTLALKNWKYMLVVPLPVASILTVIAVSLIITNIFYPLSIILLMNLSILLLLTQIHIIFIHGGILMELLRRVRNHILVAIFVIIAGLFVLISSVFLGFLGLGIIAFIGLLACSSILLFIFPHIFNSEEKQ